MRGRATTRLNAIGLPFRLKVVNDPGGYDRCDSAIFAFQRKDRDRSLPEVLRLCEELGDAIAPGIPAMTRPIVTGVGFAEDPGGGESFGADRSRLIAEALVRAHELARAAPAERLDDGRARRFREAGTSIEAPYLGSDSAGDIDLTRITNDHAEEASPCL